MFTCHAVPDGDTTYWMEDVHADGTVCKRDDNGIEDFAEGVDATLILCGHTHVPRVHRLKDGRLLVNPGSVGCPGFKDTHPLPHAIETGTPATSWALATRTGGEWMVEPHLETYDHHQMARLAKENGRPEWANALATGRIGEAIK